MQTKFKVFIVNNLWGFLECVKTQNDYFKTYLFQLFPTRLSPLIKWSNTTKVNNSFVQVEIFFSTKSRSHICFAVAVVFFFFFIFSHTAFCSKSPLSYICFYFGAHGNTLSPCATFRQPSGEHETNEISSSLFVISTNQSISQRWHQLHSSEGRVENPNFSLFLAVRAVFALRMKYYFYWSYF